METQEQEETAAGGRNVRSSDLLGGIAEKHKEMMCWRTATFCGGADKKIDGMRMAIEELCQHSEILHRLIQWRSMDTAPKDGSKIDVFHGGNVRTVRWTDAHLPNDFHWFIDRAGYIENPEAWRLHVPPNA